MRLHSWHGWRNVPEKNVHYCFSSATRKKCVRKFCSIYFRLKTSLTESDDELADWMKIFQRYQKSRCEKFLHLIKAPWISFQCGRKMREAANWNDCRACVSNETKKNPLLHCTKCEAAPTEGQKNILWYQHIIWMIHTTSMTFSWEGGFSHLNPYHIMNNLLPMAHSLPIFGKTPTHRVTRKTHFFCSRNIKELFFYFLTSLVSCAIVLAVIVPRTLFPFLNENDVARKM